MSSKSDNHGNPTEAELSALPKWALVAFAARCARRAKASLQQSNLLGLKSAVLHKDAVDDVKRILTENSAKLTDFERTVINLLLDSSEGAGSPVALQRIAKITGLAPIQVHLIQDKASEKIARRLRRPESITRERIAAVEWAILTVEESARQGRVLPDLELIAERTGPGGPHDSVSCVWSAADAAKATDHSAAVRAAARAAQSADILRLFADLSESAAAMDPEAANAAYSKACAQVLAPVHAAAHADVRRLHRLTEQYHWNGNTPVDVAGLGPLWPQGQPAWWPMSQFTLGPRTMLLPSPRLAVVWDPEAVPEADYKELMALLGELARACGAVGLQTLTSGGCAVDVEVPA